MSSENVQVLQHGTQYYWGEPTCSINWCEVDHENHHVIAEFWNTFTNLGFIIVGLNTLRIALRINGETQRARKQPMFPSTFIVACAALVLTGIFSGLFHATLKWTTQKLDELCGTITVIALLHSFRTGQRLMTVHLILAAIGIWLIEAWFCEIHMVATVVLVILSAHNTANDLQMPSGWRSYWMFKIMTLAVLAAGAWLIDRVACSQLSALTLSTNPQLHAFGWHICAALAINEALFFFAILHFIRQRKQLQQLAMRRVQRRRGKEVSGPILMSTASYSDLRAQTEIIGKGGIIIHDFWSISYGIGLDTDF